MPITEAQFERDRSIPLCDDAKNPGALNVGLWAKRFDCVATYEYKGNVTAIFSSVGNGIAALMELISNHRLRGDVVTVRDYVCGGGHVDASRSYSGGQTHYADSYLAAMKQKGVSADERLDGSIEQMKRLVIAHHYAEGGKEPLTDIDFLVAIALMQERSKNIDGTEMQNLALG